MNCRPLGERKTQARHIRYNEVAYNKATEVTGMGQEKNSTKRRKWKQISEQERYQIEALLKAKHSIKEIATQLGRDRRSMQREKARGLVEQVDSLWRERRLYLADVAQRKNEEREANKGRPLKIGHNHALSHELERLIVDERYSPDAALGWLRQYGRPGIVTICTKTLYRYIDCELFAGISNKDLPVKREGKKHHRHLHRKAYNNLKGKSIEQRPEHVESRLEEGHWEMDCVVGRSGTSACLLVVTERVTRQELILKMKSKTQACVAAVLDRLEERYGARFSKIFKTITVDNGSEFLDGERMERSIRSPSKKRTSIYYAHPYSAWERGSNENQNKLIRRFVPKGMDIGKLTQRDVKQVEYWMNLYPRRRFGYKSSSQMSTLNVA
jgi:IS30 family transposase